MDADDVSQPDRFSIQTAYLEQHPECVAVGSRVLYVDPEGWPLGYMKRESGCDLISLGQMKGHVLLRYRLHDRSVSHQYSEEQILSARKAVHAAHVRRGLLGSDAALDLKTRSKRKLLLHFEWAWEALKTGFFLTCLKHLAFAASIRCNMRDRQ